MKEWMKFIDKLTDKERRKMAEVVRQLINGNYEGLDVVKLS